MWFYIVGVVLLVVGIVGSVATGGIFTIVLIPLALIVLIGAIVYRGMGAFARSRGGGGTGAGTGPVLPHNSPEEPGHARTSPEALTDARRAQQ